MKPAIWIYGGVHDEPGSRQRFLEELSKQETPPHFVAVEWEQSLFERIATWRPSVAEGLESHWDFLTPEDCYELSCALAWEGDAYAERFPSIDVLWLENWFQETRLQRQGSDANKFAKSSAWALLQWLYCPRTLQEVMANISPPVPTSKKELIDHVYRTAWAEARQSPKNFERDARWASAICERSADLCDGWIAVVVGWAHADPKFENQQLRCLLLSEGFSVNSVYLGP
jgi:hypothetical protein